MPKNTGTFQKLSDSHERLHGRTAILVSGYPVDDQDRLVALLKPEPSLASLPVIFISEADAATTLQALAQRTADSGRGKPSSLPRAIIMSGLTGSEMHQLMHACRAAALPHHLWASVTPVSATWTAGRLLEELSRERAALRAAMQKRQSQPPSP